jgi:hypothetical protein
MDAPWDRQEIYAHCLVELEQDRLSGRSRTEPQHQLDPQLRRGSRRRDRQRIEADVEEDAPGT